MQIMTFSIRLHCLLAVSLLLVAQASSSNKRAAALYSRMFKPAKDPPGKPPVEIVTDPDAALEAPAITADGTATKMDLEEPTPASVLAPDVAA